MEKMGVPHMPKDDITTFPLIRLCNSEEAVEFLKSIWGLYTTPQCYSIKPLPGGKTAFFCGNAHDVLKEVRDYLNQLDKCIDIYYQVLPLSERPESGRGTANHVKVAKWVFADLDYKDIVDSAPFEGCKDYDDHARECYYRDGSKWRRISRPPLSKVIEEIKAKLGIEPTIVVDSGAGYHVYFQLPGELPKDEWGQIEERVVTLLGADKNAKDAARLLRLPGTENSRARRQCKVIYTSDSVLYPEDLLRPTTLDEHTMGQEPAGKISSTGKQAALRPLEERIIREITATLQSVYVPGYRQSLLLYFTGWTAKQRISPISVATIIKHLHYLSGDSDPLKTRLSTLVYSYRKAGIELAPYMPELEAIAGGMLYGAESEINNSTVKGYSGMEEILTAVLNSREKALDVLARLTELLGSPSPYDADTILAPISPKRRLHVVVDYTAKEIYIAEVTPLGINVVERVFTVVPTEITIYRNPLSGSSTYEVVFERLGKPPIRITGTKSEILAILDEDYNELVSTRSARDVFTLALNALETRNIAKVVENAHAPGFYYADGKVIAVKREVNDVDVGKLRQALELLNELAEVWFRHARAKFATVVKWGAVSPFLYTLKQKKKTIQWLYLYGDTTTGKTTLGRIVLAMWDVLSNEIRGGSFDTPARIGLAMSQDTFPLLINETANVFGREDIIDILKNAASDTIVRSRAEKGRLRNFPALNALIFTSNHVMPRDDALLRRLIVIHFGHKDKIPPERQEEFENKVRLEKLAPIGDCIAKIVLSEGLPEGQILTAGERLLAKCYEIAGMPIPSWLSLSYKLTEDLAAETAEDVRERLLQYINNAYTRHIARVVVDRAIPEENYTEVPKEELSVDEKLRILLRLRLLPYVKQKNNLVVFTAGITKELGLNDTLKGLAERLGWQYGVIWVEDKSVKAMYIEFDKLVKFLAGNIEKMEEVHE